MNKTVKIVIEWGDYEENHPEGSIADFCRYYLASEEHGTMAPTIASESHRPPTDGILLRLIGRIHKLNMAYSNMALDGTGLSQIEEFAILFTILEMKNPRKSDIVYANLLELSSGTDMLKRLRKRGLIREYEDDADKRSKRVELTGAGESALQLSLVRMTQSAKMMLHDLSENDKKLCIGVLKSVEVKFSAIWQRQKGRSFDEIFQNVVQDERNPE